MEKTKLTFKEIIKLFEIEDAKHTKKNDKIIPTENFKKLEDLVCQKCSPKQIYEIARLGLKSTNIQKLGQVIIESKYLAWNYEFARYVKGADVKAHERVIIASEDPEWNYWFARDVKRADVLTHGEVIIKSQDPEWNYEFAQAVEGADVKAHEEIVLKSQDPKWNYKFAQYVKGADILAHAQILYELYYYRLDEDYFKKLIEDLKEKEIYFKYNKNGKPVKVLSRPDQIIENFDDIEIE